MIFNSPIKVFAPAKINLSLNITEKMPNGYHRLDTVFLALSVSELLLLHKGDWIQLPQLFRLTGFYLHPHFYPRL